jgi:preprotein translocase subunit SecD
MKTALLTTFLAFATGFVFAADPSVFQLRAVADAPTKTTKEYPLPERSGATETLNLESAVLLDHTALKSATVVKDKQGLPTILITLTTVGAKRFGEITERHLGKRLGIVVGGKLLVAPFVRESILGGSLEISGSFTDEEAADLAAKLNRSN